jgi:hypothetical protein
VGGSNVAEVDSCASAGDVAVATSPCAASAIASVRSMLERVMGIEPTYLAWEANVLPLNYTRGHCGF